MIERSVVAMAEDDYIDMDVSSTSFICYSISASSPPQAKEFEFQMSADPRQRDAATSPADELFYKGKLLPLHLPPRLRMVEKLEGSSAAADRSNAAAGPADGSVPSDVSSCGAVGAEMALLEKKQRPKKTRLVKQSSSLCLKLKASRAYLKSLFTARSAALQADDCAAAGYMKAAKVNPLATGVCGEREKLMEEELLHRKSFSGAINWNLTSKSSYSSSSSASSSSSSSASSSCSSSLSSSFSSSSSLQPTPPPPQLLKRSSSVNSEMESSILGAIAYCKESQQQQQQLVSGRKSADDAGLFR